MDSPQERLKALKEKFSAPGRLDFNMAATGIVAARIESGRASASVALLGATVISYAPPGFGETLFLSGVGNFLPERRYAEGFPFAGLGSARIPTTRVFRRMASSVFWSGK